MLDKRKPTPNCPSREADYDHHDTVIWFKEEIMYCRATGLAYPCRYDEEGDIYDFWDHTQEFGGHWIDCGDCITEAYKSWLAEEELLHTNKSMQDHEYVQVEINGEKIVIPTQCCYDPDESGKFLAHLSKYGYEFFTLGVDATLI